jgi:hypothetical protein
VNFCKNKRYLAAYSLQSSFLLQSSKLGGLATSLKQPMFYINTVTNHLLQTLLDNFGVDLAAIL